MKILRWGKYATHVIRVGICMVPTWTGKPGKMRTFFQSGKSQTILNKLEMSGNFTQNTGKIGEFYPKYWKVRKFSQFLLLFFSDFFIWSVFVNRCLYLLNSLNKTLKKYWNMERKYWKSRGNLWVWKCGNYECSSSYLFDKIRRGLHKLFYDYKWSFLFAL